MFSASLKSLLIAFLLLCSVSAALFGGGCSIGLLDGVALQAPVCAMTVLGAPALPAETTGHASAMTIQVVAIVSIVLALLLSVVKAPRVLGRVPVLERRRRLRWIWARSFGHYFSHSISIPYLRATRGA